MYNKGSSAGASAQKNYWIETIIAETAALVACRAAPVAISALTRVALC